MFYRIGRPRARHFKEVRHPISKVIFISNMSINTRVGVMIILMIRVFPCSTSEYIGIWHGGRGSRIWIYFQTLFVSNIVLYPVAESVNATFCWCLVALPLQNRFLSLSTILVWQPWPIQVLILALLLFKPQALATQLTVVLFLSNMHDIFIFIC